MEFVYQVAPSARNYRRMDFWPEISHDQITCVTQNLNNKED